jgi:class 3 adenylate cyclase
MKISIFSIGRGMEATHSDYDFSESLKRIDEILDASNTSYEDSKGIPARDRLTFTNGFNVQVTVIFVDIRGSKALAEKHTRPVLAKIYRSYISEVVAALRSSDTISEIFIEGDGVWGVFNTTTKPHVDDVFQIAGRVASLIDVLNVQFEKKGYSKIDVGIGVDDGDSLYIKAGYKGSGINEVVWVGRVIGQAAALCSHGHRSYTDERIMVSELVYGSLTDTHKRFLRWNAERGCWHGNVVNLQMNEWVTQHGN